MALVDGAVLALAAGVGEVLAHRALEEPLAALAAVGQRIQSYKPLNDLVNSSRYNQFITIQQLPLQHIYNHTSLRIFFLTIEN